MRYTNSMKFELPDLPYDYNALEPAIDTETMRLHHDKHHKTYVDNTNDAIENLPSAMREEILSRLQNDGEESALRFIITQNDGTFGDVEQKLRNNAGGHINHSFFWKAMCSYDEANQPPQSIIDMLSSSFGSLDEFKSQFAAAATSRFGSGWAWLVKDKSGSLQVMSTANQDSPISLGLEPILALDVWEHAYYLRYNNRRADYIDAFWSVVDWNRVKDLLEVR